LEETQHSCFWGQEKVAKIVQCGEPSHLSINEQEQLPLQVAVLAFKFTSMKILNTIQRITLSRDVLLTGFRAGAKQ
jgi:hypothetical protein